MKLHKESQRLKARISFRCKQQGLSLVELMIGLVLGMILMAAALQVLLSSKQSFSLQKESSNIQENARFAVEMIGREIALAGFTGCRSAARVANVITGSGVSANWQFNSPGIEGFDNTEPNANFPAQYRANVLANTDTVIVRGGAANAMFTVSSYASPTFQFPAGSNVIGAIPAGSLVLASNNACTQVSIFQASAAAATTLTHGAGTPGNCTATLGNTTATTTCAAPGTSANPQMNAGSNVMPYSVSAFYVAASGVDPAVPALWRARVIQSAGAAVVRNEELLQGIENLQILYGYDTDATPDGVPNFFAIANNAALVGGTWDWGRVVSVRVAVLVRSLSPAENTAMTNATFEGIAVPTDRFARLRVFTTVQLRNRGPN